MRLRLGLLLEDLARRFHVSKSTCSNITNQWISYMSVKLWRLQTILLFGTDINKGVQQRSNMVAGFPLPET
ncbi:hypothetical protein MAR_022453 [Mya arenaria]|uniref:Transposase Helix-turn-helix domain-containing protein n=1 Tax=Mya arenaria TaxID=6604 RepID=A0ABY7DP01_MYAAR|nr:hypothetical protein MAR_022453 [Mya arenaria]